MASMTTACEVFVAVSVYATVPPGWTVDPDSGSLVFDRLQPGVLCSVGSPRRTPRPDQEWRR